MEAFNDSARRPLANVFEPGLDLISTASVTALVLGLSYVTWVSIYRLCFSPIAKFPGPKLAALTGRYEAYFDLVPKGGGQFPFATKRMHEKYGPIVHINPDELHIDDPDFFDTLYRTSKPYDKLKQLENRFGIPGATFSTARHELHKIRRAAISPFFAKSKVREQTGDIQALMNTISRRLSTDEELEHKRMQHEAESLIGAGLETTAWTLALGSFYILHNPEVYAKLQSELASAIPDATQIPPWATLETLPYLTAIVKETLRMGMGVIERLVRINRNPANPWVYKGTVIPANVAVSMDQYHMLMNENVFPDPAAFRPERWLDDPRGPDDIHPLTHYMTVFGRGTRMCLGLNLAYSELYIGFATLISRHKLRLVDTSVRDVAFYAENTILSPWPGTKGIRVLVDS
ncbi:Cytochrome P450 monooxygenase [Colletotrichum sp. SAR11_59]|nr:Cytochrome P450 monooxygenase [Colletotrichum sp. SAR11_59]